MEAMGIVKKDSATAGLSFQYSLSEKGQSFLNSILDALHKPVSHWDGKWRFVSFSSPEKQRSVRDKFRRYLESKGYCSIAGALWISPNDSSDEVEVYAARIGMKNFFIVESDKIRGPMQSDFVSGWNFGKSRKLFENFIDKSAAFLSSRDRSKRIAKEMILEYAFILNAQPDLPIELLPKDWPKFRANLQYIKIKRLISDRQTP
jgi:DNA-binding transcriptional regulator PaaX